MPKVSAELFEPDYEIDSLDCEYPLNERTKNAAPRSPRIPTFVFLSDCTVIEDMTKWEWVGRQKIHCSRPCDCRETEEVCFNGEREARPPRRHRGE